MLQLYISIASRDLIFATLPHVKWSNGSYDLRVLVWKPCCTNHNMRLEVARSLKLHIFAVSS